MFPPLKALPSFVKEIPASQLAHGYRFYNASITRLGEKLIMAYRIEYIEGNSKIAICELAPDLVPGPSTIVALVGLPNSDEEDPRVFVADGKLYLSFVEIVYPPNGNGLTVQGLARIDPDDNWRADRIPLEYGKNGHRNEKNWVFFDATKTKGQTLIGILYSIAFQKVAIFTGTGVFVEEYISAGIKNWPWGTLSGGTPALRITNTDGSKALLHFFHSRRPFAGRNAQYTMAASIMEAKEPYATLRLSREPLVWGSEQNPALVNNRSPTNNPLVIFPNGYVIEPDGSFLICLGVNDTYIAFVRFSIEDLNLVTPSEIPESILPPTKIVNNGSVRVRLKEKRKDGTTAQSQAFNGIIVNPGEVVVLTEGDAAAAGWEKFELMPPEAPPVEIETIDESPHKPKAVAAPAPQLVEAYP